MQSALKSQGASEKGHQDGECSSECKLCAVENEIEDAADLKSLGCTGIEDKLQDGVPAALQQLLDAGMKVWMLTGDTVSTAVNIAMACNLIDSDMENDKRLFVFDKDMDSGSKIRKAIDDANKQVQQAKSKQSKRKGKDGEGETAVDGPLFGLAMHGDVWKLMQRSKKRKKTEEKQDKGGSGGSGEESTRTSPDLFRQKMGQRKKSKRNLLDGQDERSDDKEQPNKEDDKESGKKKEKEKESGKKEKEKPEGKKEEKKGKSNDKDDSQTSSSTSSSAEATLLDHFFTLCSSCQSVIACRLEPKEKADIVDQMRDRTHRCCLAIGDGRQAAALTQTAFRG